MARQQTDVCIVGSGAAGGAVAEEFTRAGLTVTMLERGPAFNIRDMRQMDEIRFGQRSGLSGNAMQPSVLRATSDIPGATVRGQASGTGGGTLHWAAMSWRMHEDDFRLLSKYGPRPGYLLADWPVSYADMEPWYDKAEYEIGVSGVWARAGGNPFEAPRSRDYPVPPLADRRIGIVFRDAVKQLGYHPFPVPAAILSQPYKGRSACSYCGFCRQHACHTDAKHSSLVTSIPAAQATGNFTLLNDCTVSRINTDSSGQRAVSVSYFDPSGAEQTLEAGLFYVAANENENPRLLLLSASDANPNGLGNNTGWVGKARMAHTRPRVIALYDDTAMNAHTGPNHPFHAIDDFNADNFDHAGLDFIRGGVVFTNVNAAGGPLSFYDTLPPDAPRWGSAYKAYLHKYFIRYQSIDAWIEMLPHEQNYQDLDPRVRDRFGLPVWRYTITFTDNCRKQNEFMIERMKEISAQTGASQTFVIRQGPTPTAHSVGGTRIGFNRNDSVANEWGQLWDTPNVFLGGSTLYPTQSGFNPTLTIYALAYRTADYVLRQAQAGGSLTRYL
jgi:gluconate 2-dehydrogenase alpha chain